MDISELLSSIIDSKINISGAIVSKGIDLTDIPLSGYSEKILQIGEELPIMKYLDESIDSIFVTITDPSNNEEEMILNYKKYFDNLPTYINQKDNDFPLSGIESKYDVDEVLHRFSKVKGSDTYYIQYVNNKWVICKDYTSYELSDTENQPYLELPYTGTFEKDNIIYNISIKSFRFANVS